ncbi:hypothetical protein NX021_09960 [Cytobacillus firmus]|nr:hypothetical protein [Cytobacillus firmus]
MEQIRTEKRETNVNESEGGADRTEKGEINVSESEGGASSDREAGNQHE